MKVDFIRKYWPHLEVVGTFHSHPYENLEQAKSVRGWQASEDDESFWPYIHQSLFPQTPFLAHFIVTVAALGRTGTAYPTQIENNSGYELSMGRRKVWVTSYATASLDEGDEVIFSLMQKPRLDIPSLAIRTFEGNYRR